MMKFKYADFRFSSLQFCHEYVIHGKSFRLQISLYLALLCYQMYCHSLYIQMSCSLASHICLAHLSQVKQITDFEFAQADVSEPSSIVQSQGDRGSRFIGDLNPEGIFLAATSPDATRGVSNDSIGVW
jgi:hypothetical protein